MILDEVSCRKNVRKIMAYWPDESTASSHMKEQMNQLIDLHLNYYAEAIEARVRMEVDICPECGEYAPDDTLSVEEHGRCTVCVTQRDDYYAFGPSDALEGSMPGQE